MTTVAQLLEHKGSDIYAIAPEATVLDAIKEFVEKNVGSLMVMEGENLIGIFTERQYARKVFLKGKDSPTTPVREVMETKIAYVDPQKTSAATCLSSMTARLLAWFRSAI